VQGFLAACNALKLHLAARSKTKKAKTAKVSFTIQCDHCDKWRI